MIARVWHGRVPVQRAEEYQALMTAIAIPDYRVVPGNLGAWCLRRDTGQGAEFERLTFWSGIEPLRSSAGEDYEAARYYDFDDDFLIEKEPRVRHFTVHGEAGPAGQLP